MNRKLALVFVLLTLLTYAPSVIAEQAPLPRLFPNKATVTFAPGPALGLTQLQLPAAVHRLVKPDLSDVRLVDQNGREVPYVLDSSDQPWRDRRDSVEKRYASIKRIARNRRRVKGRQLYHEEFVIERPTPHLRIRDWALVLNSRKRRFVAHVKLLDDDNPDEVLVDGSLYRLRAPLREGLHLALPQTMPERLRLVIESEEGYLEPTASYRGRKPHELAPLRMPLPIVEQSSEQGITTIVVERPRGVLPLGLAISSATGTFHRVFTVADSGPGGSDSRLGQHALYRLTTSSGVSRLTMPLRRASGNRLTLRIDDGDSPALLDVRVFAIVEPPTLLFDVRAPVTLLFGGGRAHLPKYDVAGLIDRTPLEDERNWRVAKVGEVTPNEAFDPSPALAFLLKAGAKLETNAFAKQRSLEVRGAKEGLSRLRLDTNDIAASHNNLGDIRIVDDSGQQWSYLLERHEVMLTFDARIGAPHVRADGTHYTLDLPAAPLEVDRIQLHTDAALVRRPYQLYGRHKDKRMLLVSGTLSRYPGRTKALQIQLPHSPQEQLELVVEDGGDAPLAFKKAQLEVASADLYLAAPDGNYTLLIGNKLAEPPAYELIHARQLALALPAPAIKAAPLTDNVQYQPPTEDPAPNRLMWGALLLAVLVLAGITFRVARESRPESDSAPATAARAPAQPTTNPAQPSPNPAQPTTNPAQPKPDTAQPHTAPNSAQPSTPSQASPQADPQQEETAETDTEQSE